MNAPARPNLVLISADQWRGDVLGVAGDPVIHTPGIDAMAAAGHYFPRAVTELPSCVGARRTLFSGQWPVTHGMTGFDDLEPWPEPDTLCRVFQRNGYRTYAVGKRHVYPQDARYGFDLLRTHEEGRFLSPGFRDDYLAMLDEKGWGEFGLFGAGVTNNSYHARAAVLPPELHVTTWTATEAIRVMEDHVRAHGRDQPFFLYVSFSKPHPPWDPPAQFFDHYYRDPDLPMPVVGDAAGYVRPPRPFVSSTRGPIPEGEVFQLKARDLRRARAGYYGLIDQIDAQITRLAYHLWRNLLVRNTIFAFVADHGEMLGDHHWWAKSVGYEGAIRVPFVLSFPKELPLPAGRAYPEAAVGLADLMPTVLDACGLPIPDRCDGSSLMPLIRGEKDALDRGPLHGEHLEYCHFLVDHTQKFIWHYRMGVKEYYDLQEDPAECRNRYAADPRARELQERLTALLVDQGREDDFMRDGRLDDATAQAHTHEPPAYAR